MKAIVHPSTASGPLTPIEVTIDVGVPLHLIPERVSRQIARRLREHVTFVGWRVTADALRIVGETS